MKKKVSFQLFMTVLQRGICQFLEKVARFFGYRGEARPLKVMWHLIAVCITSLVVLFTGCILYAFATQVVYEKWICSSDQADVYESLSLSQRLEFQKTFSSETGQVYDKFLKKILLEDVDWVVASSPEDSLAVYCQHGKRGYLHRYTGEVVILPSYSKAWIFSEGLAAVEKDGELMFVNSKGETVIKKNFTVDFLYRRDYVFQNGYCVMQNPRTGKLGLIDKSGQWALQPEYDHIYNNNGFWLIEKNNLEGLLAADLKVMFPVANKEISVSDESIEVHQTNHIAKLYDLEGNLLIDFVIDNVENLYFEEEYLHQDSAKNEDNFENLKVYDVANCYAYEVNNWNDGSHYGLMDRKGRVITPPRFTGISAVGRDLYLCQPDGILLDGQGKIVR